MSGIIADLLNPREPHGQGSRFLDLFVELLGNPWAGRDREGARVRVEAQTDLIEASQRRIDVLIQLTTGIIGIENKLWAGDLSDQVGAYLRQLEARAEEMGHPGQYLLIYLTPTGRLPDEGSINTEDFRQRLERGQLRLMSYREIVVWLETCKAAARAPDVITHLEHLTRYIRVRILQERDVTDLTKILAELMADPIHAEAVQTLMEQHETVRWIQLGKLADDIQAAIGEKGWNVRKRFRDGYYSRIEIHFGGAPNVMFGFEFHRPKASFSKLRCGLKWLEGQRREDPPVSQALKSSLGFGQEPDGWWPWWFDVSEGNEFLPIPGDWTSDQRPWRMIDDGTLQPLVIALAQRVCDALPAAGLIVPPPGGLPGTPTSVAA